MSLYSKYLRERTNDQIIDKQYGFATYRYVDKSVYIVDIFVDPDFRNTHLATEMADEIVKEAKEKGCTELLGSVVPSTKNSTISLKVLLGYGMTLHAASNDFIVFKKEF